MPFTFQSCLFLINLIRLRQWIANCLACCLVDCGLHPDRE